MIWLMFKIKNKELTFTHPHLQKEISWFYTICLCVREREGVCRFTCELYNPNLWRSKLIFSHYISSCQLAFPENTSTTAKKITNGCVFVCVVVFHYISCSSSKKKKKSAYFGWFYLYQYRNYRFSCYTTQQTTGAIACCCWWWHTFS